MTSEGAAACVSPPDATSEDPSAADPDGCLTERKYWCFLLSSICTFLAGLLVVLIWRAFAFLCCRKEAEYAPNDPKQKEQKAQRGKQEFEGTFMTEAKDWAGELISGQTTTGRILVSIDSAVSIMHGTHPCIRASVRPYVRTWTAAYSGRGRGHGTADPYSGTCRRGCVRRAPCPSSSSSCSRSPRPP